MAEPGPWHRNAALAAALRACGIGVPPDLPWLQRQAEAAAAAIAACPVATLCQGAGSAGNVLISPNRAVQLVDDDLAGVESEGAIAWASSFNTRAQAAVTSTRLGVA